MVSHKFVRGKAIHNAINLRLNPIFVEEENLAAHGQGGVFAKIPAETLPLSEYKQDFLSQSYISNTPKFSISTKRIAKVLFLDKPFNMSETTENYDHFLKIPIISQPFSDYKLVVATAPWNMRISGSDSKPVVIYYVFPEDDNEPTSVNIPEIYFVKKGSEPKDINKKDKFDPLILVDHNRTVTGLKSKTVSKFIKIKNRLHQ